MQITSLSPDQVADVIAESTALAQIDWGASCAHVMTSTTGRDFILIYDQATRCGFMVDGCAYDSDAGGSVHAHARAIADGPH